jgi:hypothetical protein
MPPPLHLGPGGAGSPEPAVPRAGSAAGTYYEDVDPRFENIAPGLAPGQHTPRPTPPPIQTRNDTYPEHLPPGARSPAESERSNFTSISQRGVNPRWNPGPAPPHPGAIPRRPVNRSDGILNSNPDFELPGGRNTPSRGGGMTPGSAYPTGPI